MRLVALLLLPLAFASAPARADETRPQPAPLHIGGPGADAIIDVALTADAMIVTGTYSGTVDFDFGPGQSTLRSHGATDVFVARYDRQGGLLWVRGLGGTDADAPSAMAVDGEGGVWVAGVFTDGTDLDPGAGRVMVKAAAGLDAFLIRLDAEGALTFSHALGSAASGSECTGAERACTEILDLAVTKDGGVHAVGRFSGRIDARPGDGVATLLSRGLTDGFVAHYGRDGTLTYAGRVGGEETDDVCSVAIAPAGGAYVAGSFSRTADVDPTEKGEHLLRSAGGRDAFVVLLDEKGAHVRSFSVSGPNDDVPARGGLRVSESGSLLFAGRAGMDADLDPGPNRSVLPLAGGGDAVFVRYGADGRFESAFRIGGAEMDGGLAFMLVGEDPVVACLIHGSVDADPGSGTAYIHAPTASAAAVIARYAPDGTLRWSHRLAAGRPGLKAPAEELLLTTLVADGDGVLVAGTFEGMLSLPPRGGPSVRSEGMTDGYIARYGPDGNRR